MVLWEDDELDEGAAVEPKDVVERPLPLELGVDEVDEVDEVDVEVDEPSVVASTAELWLVASCTVTAPVARVAVSREPAR